jgi:hypothetical protein
MECDDELKELKAKIYDLLAAAANPNKNGWTTNFLESVPHATRAINIIDSISAKLKKNLHNEKKVKKY